MPNLALVIGVPETTNVDEVGQSGVNEALVTRLQAIASPNRLELLTMLQEPRAVSDIELETTAEDRGEERKISRQGVRHHLNKLRDAGFVETRRSRGGKRVHQYVADRPRLYELGEVLRELAQGGAADTDDLEAPITWDSPTSPAPTLTVTHGAALGRSFALQGDPTREGRGWVLGRGDDVDISLDWDPYVDRQAAEIELRGDELMLVDLRATPHRVSLNGGIFRRGESRKLTDGDLIGVGRSLLAFRE